MMQQKNVYKMMKGLPQIDIKLCKNWTQKNKDETLQK